MVEGNENADRYNPEIVDNTMMKKKVTIYSLSKDLGVSPATVSKALNNSPELNADTIAMIRRRAEESGFRPRQMASRVHNICALIPSGGPQHNGFSPFAMDVMRGMMDYLQENGLEFSMYSDTEKKMNDGLLLRHLGRRNISGAVLINPLSEGIFYENFKKSHFPYINLFGGPAQPAKNLLMLDHVEVAFRAVDYLIQIGHRKIAIVMTPATTTTGKSRLEGYKKALSRAGIPIDPSLIWGTNKNQYGLEAGFDAIMDLRRSNPEFTAVFLMGDQTAIGSLHALHQLGLSVPGQVSLLTCDDAPEIRYLDPPLTVMDIPNRKFGYTAAQRVHQMIINDDSTQASPAQEPWMRGELIIRDSTAPPRK